MFPEKLARINVVGTSGSGKSTFAKKLAAKLHVPYIEIDALFWKPNWQHCSDEEFFEALSDALRPAQAVVLRCIKAHFLKPR